MSRSSTLGSVLYNLETAWGEDVDTFGSRMAVIGRIDVSSLVQEQIERNVVVDRKQGGYRRALGTFGGDIKTSGGRFCHRPAYLQGAPRDDLRKVSVH